MDTQPAFPFGLFASTGPQPVAFKKSDPRALAPDYQTPGAAGFDLAVLDGVSVSPCETKLARTGLVIATPPGHMLMLTPRSSTWRKWGVRLGNTVGIVDEDYSGDEDEVLLALWNPSANATQTVPAGTRIAQGIFVPVNTRVRFEEHLFMMAPTRGGWGSTGQ